MLDPNRTRNQLPPPVTTGRGQFTPGTPIAPRTAQGSLPVGPQRVDFSSTPALQKLLQPAPASKGYTQSNVNASRGGAGLVAPPLPPPNPVEPPPTLPRRTGEEPAPQSGGGQPGGGLVPAAQAAEPLPPPNPGGRPVSRTADGVFPYAYGENGAQQGFAFRDPLNGRERGFATREEAQAALAAGAARTPEAVTAARSDLLQRAERGAAITGGQIPEGAFNEKEQALLPGLRQVSLAAPAIGSASPPPNLPLAKGEEGGGEGAADGVDVIRGTSVQRAAGDAGNRPSPVLVNGRLPNDALQDALVGIAEARMEHGADSSTWLPVLQSIAINEARRQAATRTEPLTRSQVEGQLLQQMNPDALTERDRLVFGNGGAEAAPKLYSKPEYDQYGAQIGEVPYLYDAEGNARPLNFAAPAAAEAPAAVGEAPAPPQDVTQTPQARAIHKAVREGKMSRQQANRALSALRTALQRQ